MKSVRRPAPFLGSFAGVGLTVIASLGLLPMRDGGSRATPALVLVVPVLVAGVLGGPVSALTTAIVAAVAFNVGFIEPYGTLTIHEVDDVVALFVFLGVAVVVGAIVAREAASRRAALERARDVEDMHRRYEEVVAQREAQAAEATRLSVLEQVDEQRRALIRSVSHDLRTPLSTIRAVASDLRSGTVYDQDTRDELLDLVSDETQRLDRLVANLLSLSRIEAGALNPDVQAVDLDELVRDRVRRLDRLFRQVRVQIEMPLDLPLVTADYVLLDQVVTNLLENAARHAPPRSTVRVGARVEGGDVVAWVSDEGIGVPTFQAKRVFEPFQRGENSNSSGVGLAICRAIVEAHGGTIGVEAVPGGGARFSFRITARRD